MFSGKIGLSLLILAGLSSESMAQVRPEGIKAESVMEKLMIFSQGDRNQAYAAVEELTSCSGYFGAFQADVYSKRNADPDAVQGLGLMQQDTALVAVMVWSQHSTNPTGEVEAMAKEALNKESEKIRILGGTDNIPFLQRYDECSQAFLFSEFMLGTAQDAAKGQ